MNSNIPITTVDWSQKFNKKKLKYLIIALLVATFATLNSYKLLHRAQSEAELVSVIVASRDITQYSLLEDTDTELRKIRRDQLPKHIIISLEEIKKSTTLINISKNQILTSNFFREVTNPDSISAEIKEGLTAMSIGFDWLIAPVPGIKAGDLIDIIASESHTEHNGIHSVITSESKIPVRNAKVLEVVKEGEYSQSGHIVLEVTEEQASNLMSTKALKVFLNIIIK